jgi:hypothetical protein
VVAIFMGSLGAGGWILGRIADRRSSPWGLYARLEALVALTAAVTPPLLWAARELYLALGGSVVLGLFAGTILRLLLATLVLLPPMFLAGGTLPAAARAVQFDGDRRRRGMALLYGINTLGAVAGAIASTFWLLETFGTRRTLWIACLLNLLVAVLARAVTFPRATEEQETAPDALVAEAPPLPAPLVVGAAGAVGFAFFLMELVWYRMLAPILGGTVYTFGLILAVALVGVGLGGLAYALVGARRPPTVGAFAATCWLEAACLAVPFALGDHIAALALRMRPEAPLALLDYVSGWILVASIVILPASIVAGAQFPLLVALLGRGRRDIGRQLGLAYAGNTVGAIAGALAGGFGLLPVLSAPGCWRAAALGLAVTGLAVSVAGRAHRLTALACLAGTGVLAAVLFAVPGPTAAWRHSGIGTGRSLVRDLSTPNAFKAWTHQTRRVVVWQEDGVESSVALQNLDGLAFIVNGKIDGNSRGDAGTQVMSGLLGALLHPAPRSVLVVGLGTGSTAGWLAAVPTIERTDVVELEPSIAEVARACAPVNRGVMANPRVAIRYGDAREVLMTTPRRYDLIFSEPSNPYRAGIASLFTREFYRAASNRLAEGGLFLQWMQAYEVDEDTVYRVLATLQSVFDSVEVWQTQANDLLLVGSRGDRVLDGALFAARTRQSPFREALRATWGADTPEAALARYVAGPAMARAAAADRRELNTDDRNHLEFGFARMVGRNGPFRLHRMRRAAQRLGADRPSMTGPVDWAKVADERISMNTAYGENAILDRATEWQPERASAHTLYLARQVDEAARSFLLQARPARGPVEIALLAEGLAQMGDERALAYIDSVRADEPIEADAILGRLRFRQQRHEEAAAALERAFVAYRDDPWPAIPMMRGALAVAVDLARARPELGPRLFAALGQPFSAFVLDTDRLDARVRIARTQAGDALCHDAVSEVEPPPWNLEFLLYRRNCYESTGDPRFVAASRDMDEYLRNDPVGR